MPKEPDQNPRKALGKGLSALLPSRQNATAAAAPAVTEEPKAEPEVIRTQLPENFEEFCSIPLDRIQPNEDQPRTSFDVDKLQELSRSIQANGLLQPITVQKIGPDQYRLIAGERRWRAAGIAGWKEIPALVRSVEQLERLELALIENIQREDLNPIEIAIAFHNLANQHGLSHEQIAERTGKERPTVTNFLRLLRLSSVVQNALISEQISMGHARVLLGLPDEAAQIEFYRRIINEGLSVRDTERLVRELTTSTQDSGKHEASGSKQPAQASPGEPKHVDANTRAALDAMAAALGTKVTIQTRSPTSGKLEIEYYSTEDLERIYSIIVN